MDFKFNHVKISGILSVIPENESFFEDEMVIMSSLQKHQ